MPNLNGITFVFFLMIWNTRAGMYLPRQQGLGFQNQHQGYHLPHTNANAKYGNFYASSRGYQRSASLSPKAVNDFEYVPTAQGYRYSFVLNDGTSGGDNVITNDVLLPSSKYSGVDAKNTGFNSIGIGGRPKNRKLSPKTLQSLAG